MATSDNPNPQNQTPQEAPAPSDPTSDPLPVEAPQPGDPVSEPPSPEVPAGQGLRDDPDDDPFDEGNFPV